MVVSRAGALKLTAQYSLNEFISPSTFHVQVLNKDHFILTNMELVKPEK